MASSCDRAEQSRGLPWAPAASSFMYIDEEGITSWDPSKKTLSLLRLLQGAFIAASVSILCGQVQDWYLTLSFSIPDWSTQPSYYEDTRNRKKKEAKGSAQKRGVTGSVPQQQQGCCHHVHHPRPEQLFHGLVTTVGLRPQLLLIL